MSAPLLLLVSAIYVYVAIEQARHGNMPGSLVWASYACANVGMLLSNK